MYSLAYHTRVSSRNEPSNTEVLSRKAAGMERKHGDTTGDEAWGCNASSLASLLEGGDRVYPLGLEIQC